MTKSHLVPCSACSRHVRTSEEACPFCSARLPAALRQTAKPVPPTARLTRAALFAFGTGTMAVAPAACSSSSSSGNVTYAPPYGLAPLPDAGDDDDATVSALYGAPADDGGGPGLVEAAYGAPGDAFPVETSPLDASDASAADASDGSGEVGVDAAYGGPGLTVADAAPDDSGHNATPAYGLPAH